MGEIHELFVLALSLVWFPGVTPDFMISELITFRITKENFQGINFTLISVSTIKLCGRFGYFRFFCSGEGKGELEAQSERGGSRFFIGTPRRGGGLPGGGWGQGPGGCLRGRLNYFLSGPKFPPREAHKLNKVLRQTGVYRLLSQGFPVVCKKRETDRKKGVSAGTPGCPGGCLSCSLV